MSTIVNKRNLMETVQALVKAREPNEHHLSAVFQTLAQVATDMTGQDCELVLRFKLGPGQK